MRPTDRQRRIAQIVTKVFGLSGLRPGQQSVIDAVLAGTHTLAIMPTGAGKSLCYVTQGKERQPWYEFRMPSREVMSALSSARSVRWA